VRTALALALAPIALLALLPFTAGSCSLGLDESLIDRAQDGAPIGEGTLPDGQVIDVPPDDGGAPDASGPSTCTADATCTTADGCLKGHCDLGRHVCVYDVCRAACAASACNRTSHACAAATAYKYRAAQIAVGSPVCARCAVAAYPWLFTVTAAGAVAFDVSNPSNSTPTRVPIAGLPFTPTQVVASGSRIWMTGAVGAGAVPAAYIDVPPDPFTATLTAHSATLAYDQAAGGFFLLPGSGGAALLVGPNAPFPATLVNAPLADTTRLVGTGLPVPAGLAPTSATSGRRLALYGLNPLAAPEFSLVDGVGGPGPAASAVTTIGGITVTTARGFGASPEGAMFWAAGTEQPPDGVGGGPTTRSVYGAFLLDSATAAINETSPGADIEVFNVPANVVADTTPVIGPMAMLDANTVMVTSMSRDNPAQSAVQFVKRTPLGVVKEADGVTPRRLALPFAVGSLVAATASDGIGYVVANDPAAGNDASIVAFDIGCAP
jgi:hypothetical protein